MLDYIPTSEELSSLLGAARYAVWCDTTALIDGLYTTALIDGLYEMESTWNSGGKQWNYEYKYRRGGKTLCAMYARTDCFGFMVVLGAKERERFEAERGEFSDAVLTEYDAAATYHDGKWLMLTSSDSSILPDIKRLLLIKRKPNKK